MTDVIYEKLEDAFDYVSSGEIIQASAFVSRETGRIYWISDDLEDEELPEDLENPKLYAEVPTQRELGLGKRLALRFASQELPEKFDLVDGYFRRRGAYGRFKDLLAKNSVLKNWYRFEEESIRHALCEWAEEEGFTVIEQRRPDAT